MSVFSYLHRNVSLRFLTCEPNLLHSDHHTDEADIFYRDPLTWLNVQYISNNHSTTAAHRNTSTNTFHDGGDLRNKTVSPPPTSESIHQTATPPPYVPTQQESVTPAPPVLPTESLRTVTPPPTHIVMFDELHRRISSWLRDVGYKLCYKAFHTDFPDGRVSSSVLVMCL